VSAPPFVPESFDVPAELVTEDFRLTPLGPEHNAGDYAAWTSSMDHIRATPGFADRSWPVAMDIEDNLGDLQQHHEDFLARSGFTYTVLDHQNAVIGCVYIYPSTDAGSDAAVRSWVRADVAHLDRILYDAVWAWLRAAWPFGNIAYAPRSA
jgi:hypothetical protein